MQFLVTLIENCLEILRNLKFAGQAALSHLKYIMLSLCFITVEKHPHSCQNCAGMQCDADNTAVYDRPESYQVTGERQIESDLGVFII